MDEFLQALNKAIRDTEPYIVKVNGTKLDMKFNSVEEIAKHLADLNIDADLHFEFFQNDEKVGEYFYSKDLDDEDEEDEEKLVSKRTIQIGDYLVTLTIERINND